MFANDRTIEPFPLEPSHGPTPREIELARLRRNLFLFLLASGTVLVASLTGSTSLVLWQFVVWSKKLPRGVAPSWDKLMQEAPSVFYTSVAAGIVGAILAAGALTLLLKLLGRNNWPPKKAVLGVTVMPLFIAFAGVGPIINGEPELGILLMLPLMLGFACSMPVLQLGLLATGQTSIALSQLRQRPTPIAPANLPSATASYFSPVDADALELGLTPLGDYSYLPHWKKYRRYWMAPNGAYFIDATWASTGQSILSAVSVSSATSDGHYFETVDQSPQPGLRNADSSASLIHITYQPNQPLAVLLEKHIEAIGAWVEQKGCAPLEFAAADLHAFTNYGIAAFMRETQSDNLWLGNPYFGQPLPPLPGRPWQPEVSLSGL